MKVNRHGQSEPINEQVYRKISKYLLQLNHKLIFDIAYYTGERWGAILQLQVSDVYRNANRRQLHDQITFRANTRKDGTTRQVPINPDLKLRLQAYIPPDIGYLFPSPTQLGKPLSFRAASRALERALERAGLKELGYSTHSTRRGFITDLHNKGVAIRVIQSITGHKSLSVLSRYIEVSEQQRYSAIAIR
ncbi:MAG: site-specific integrase [Coleofasciculaceae cyanobacterium]